MLADNRSPMPKVYVRLARDARDTSTFKYTIVRDLSCIFPYIYMYILPYTRYIYTGISGVCLFFPSSRNFPRWRYKTVAITFLNVFIPGFASRFRIASSLRRILSNLSALPDHRPTIECGTFVLLNLVKRIRAHPFRSPSEKRLVMFFNVSTGNTTPNIDVSQGRGDLTGSGSPFPTRI